MTLSLPLARRATKCLVPGASAIYLFNEGSGTTLRDFSGNANDGTLGAGAAAPTWGPTGLTFDGDAYVDLGNVIGTTAGPFSVTVVFKKHGAAEGNIISHNSSLAATGGTGFYITYLANGQIVGRIYDADASKTRINFTIAANPNLAEYQAVTLVHTGAAVVAYNRTVATFTQAAGYTPCTTVNAFLSKMGDADWGYITGEINATVAYPFALTAGQVAANDAALKAILAPRGVSW